MIYNRLRRENVRAILRVVSEVSSADQAEEVLSYEISDEALDGAAGIKRAAHYTLFYCTALDLCPVPKGDGGLDRLVGGFRA